MVQSVTSINTSVPNETVLLHVDPVNRSGIFPLPATGHAINNCSKRLSNLSSHSVEGGIFGDAAHLERGNSKTLEKNKGANA